MKTAITVIIVVRAHKEGKEWTVGPEVGDNCCTGTNKLFIFTEFHWRNTGNCRIA